MSEEEGKPLTSGTPAKGKGKEKSSDKAATLSCLDFVILSLPLREGDTVSSVIQQSQVIAGREKIGSSVQFAVPELPVGTFDALLTLSDDLAKADQYAESVCRKIISAMSELCASNPDLGTPLGWTVGTKAPDAYLGTFSWEERKFPHAAPLGETLQRIQTLLQRIESDLRSRTAKYTAAERALAQDERQGTGSLTTRGLGDVVKPDDVLETEYLTTVFVVVPKSQYKVWEESYETLSDFVLPKSSKKLAEDETSGLFSVILFKRVADDFRNHAHEAHFTIRDVDVTGLTQESRETREKRAEEKSSQQNKLHRWCRIHFGESFTAWMHVKAMRLYVESILRYGLPPRFAMPLLLPAGKMKDLEKTLDALERVYGPIYGDKEAGDGKKGPNKKEKKKEEEMDAAAAAYSLTAGGGSHEKLLSFVYTTIHLELIAGQY